MVAEGISQHYKRHAVSTLMYRRLALGGGGVGRTINHHGVYLYKEHCQYALTGRMTLDITHAIFVQAVPLSGQPARKGNPMLVHPPQTPCTQLSNSNLLTYLFATAAAQRRWGNIKPISEDRQRNIEVTALLGGDHDPY